MAYFISNQSYKIGKNPNIYIIDGYITSKEKHMLIFSSQTTPTNTSPSTKENM